MRPTFCSRHKRKYIFLSEKSQSKHKLFDVVFARNANAHPTSIVYNWQYGVVKPKRTTDSKEKLSRMSVSERASKGKKELYQMNITVWWVKPITISTYILMHTHIGVSTSTSLNFCYPKSDVLPLNLLTSIENRISKWYIGLSNTVSTKQNE